MAHSFIPSLRCKLIPFQEVEAEAELEEWRGSRRWSEATSVCVGGALGTDVEVTVPGTACLCPPSVHALKSCSQCDGIWEGGSWEVIGLDEVVRVGLPRRDWCPQKGKGY